MRAVSDAFLEPLDPARTFLSFIESFQKVSLEEFVLQICPEELTRNVGRGPSAV